MKQTNKTILLVLSLWTIALSAQSTEIKYPTADEFKTYLLDRSSKLQQQLYNKCREGVFSLYKTDSLKTKFDAATFKERGASSNATSDVLTPLKAEEITGLLFLKSYTSPFELADESNTITSVALLYQPMFGGYVLVNQPLVWLSMSELKTKLTAEDYQFLVYLAKFRSASNNYKIWEDDNIPYFDLFDRQFSYIEGDTVSTRFMSRMLASGSEYIDLIRTTQGADADKDVYRITDEQSKRQISLNDVGNTYMQEIIAFISTDEDDPTKGYDTSFREPQYIRNIKYLVFDAGKVTQMRSELNLPGLSVAKFTIPRTVYENYKPAKHILWYLDDYVRWYNKRTLKGKK